MATSTAIQSGTTHAPPQPQNRRSHGLSLFTLVLGVALLIYMVTVEDEPGALPLGLILLGTSWLVYARLRMRPSAVAR